MTSIDLTATSRASRAAHIVREWWPAPAFIAGALLAQQLLVSSRYEVGACQDKFIETHQAGFRGRTDLIGCGQAAKQ